MTDNQDTATIEKEHQSQKLDAFRQLKLHQSLQLDDEMKVTRVASGWIYETRIECHNQDEPLGYAVSSCFVPYSTTAALGVMVQDAQSDL